MDLPELPTPPTIGEVLKVEIGLEYIVKRLLLKSPGGY